VTHNGDIPSRPSRRGFLAGAAGGLAAAGAGFAARAATPTPPADLPTAPADTEPFWGPHQGGILTAPQSHSYFAAFDLHAKKREDVTDLLRRWTAAAARLANGLTAAALELDPTAPEKDSGEALGLKPARLTVTFGFGPGLFEKDGKDRYGLAARRPAALAELPRFNGDQLQPDRSGGDLSVQACADDPQVAFHAVRQLARLGYGVADIRWAQAGFSADPGAKQTPRNLMGFKDGTGNPDINDAKAVNRLIWVGDEGPDWMRGGSYLVTRRIRIALEHWDRMKLGFQEQTIGRHKYSGAPIGLKDEYATLPLDATDKDGNPVIAENAHVRLAAAASNHGAQVLRRGYSYNDGVNFTAERRPPRRQGMAYDAGLFFICYQRDPRTGFVKIFERMAKFDMLNQFVTHTGTGLFACPAGTADGAFIGHRLFESV
jgi:deferrochelatase/peroxidase EfeB